MMFDKTLGGGALMAVVVVVALAVVAAACVRACVRVDARACVSVCVGLCACGCIRAGARARRIARHAGVDMAGSGRSTRIWHIYAGVGTISFGTAFRGTRNEPF